jgi:hypothetical protein
VSADGGKSSQDRSTKTDLCLVSLVLYNSFLLLPSFVLMGLDKTIQSRFPFTIILVVGDLYSFKPQK